MKDNILLKKLSKKSKFSGLMFKYLDGLSVEKVLNEKPHKIALVYFKYEKITFTDDILEELGIKWKFEIKKPGIDLNAWHEFTKAWLDSLPKEELEKLNEKRKQKFKYISIYKLQYQRELFSNKNLVSANQGHGYNFNLSTLKI